MRYGGFISFRYGIEEIWRHYGLGSECCFDWLNPSWRCETETHQVYLLRTTGSRYTWQRFGWIPIIPTLVQNGDAQCGKRVRTVLDVDFIGRNVFEQNDRSVTVTSATSMSSRGAFLANVTGSNLSLRRRAETSHRMCKGYHSEGWRIRKRRQGIYCYRMGVSDDLPSYTNIIISRVYFGEGDRLGLSGTVVKRAAMQSVDVIASCMSRCRCMAYF